VSVSDRRTPLLVQVRPGAHDRWIPIEPESPGRGRGSAEMMMMIFYFFLEKQKIAYHYLPVWVHLREIEGKTRVMMLLSCSLWYHDASVPRCCPKHALLHHPQCPFIQMIDTDVTLLLDYTNLTPVVWI
jgi:hypothetical protein